MADTLREACIIAPVRDNDGYSTEAARKYLERELCRHFGGFTATPGHGGWVDPDKGTLINDVVMVYTVAMAPTTACDAILDACAATFKSAARQLAVYVRHATGDVVIA